MTTKSARLALWLFALDLVYWCGGYGSRLYYWTVGKASDCVEWS